MRIAPFSNPIARVLLGIICIKAEPQIRLPKDGLADLPSVLLGAKVRAVAASTVLSVATAAHCSKLSATLGCQTFT